MEITGGQGVEYSFEAIGVPAAATQAFNILRPGGTCTVVGMHPWIRDFIPRSCFLAGEENSRLHVRIDSIPEHMPKLIDLFLQDRLDLTSLVSRRLKLEDVNEAFRSMKAGEVARSVLEFS